MESGDRQDVARAYVERLESSLAAALHQRDIEAEKARLADEGVQQLKLRLERAERERERALAEAGRERERALAQAERGRIEAARELERQASRAERELSRAERDHERKATEVGQKLADVQGKVAARDAELGRLRADARERERRLALAETRLEKAQQRAERFRASLVDLRSGRAYRLMRVLWRLRRPFGRTRRRPGGVETGSTDDVEPAPAPRSGPDAATSPPRVAIAERRRPALRTPGEPLRVASILDEISAACFAPECELIPLTLEGWGEQLDQRPPDLLLVESAWNGNGGEWQYRIAQYPRPDLSGLPALRELIDGCRERGIPTVFWNKEDPVHFDRFAEAASLFDHVFTTDAGCLERYRALSGERTVAPLPFAAQPRLHNPAAAVPERSSSPCFAGAWYRDRHPDRRRALAGLLDAARSYGLVIYDRRFGDEGDAFGFPDRFAPHVLGKLSYDRILDVYKSHQVFLNANSVVDSPTMCSRRVFELAACDTAILSTPAAALSELLGAGMVEEVADEASASAALECLLGDERERKRRTRAARRAVFAEHTYAHRLATIVEAAGLDPPPSEDGWELVLAPGVSLSETALADLGAAATFADADVIGAHPASNGNGPIEHCRTSQLDPRALLFRRELLESRGRPTGPEQVHAQLCEWADEGVRLYAADADLVESHA